MADVILDSFQPDAEMNSCCPSTVVASEDSEEGNSNIKFPQTCSSQWSGLLKLVESLQQRAVRRSLLSRAGVSCPS